MASDAGGEPSRVEFDHRGGPGAWTVRGLSPQTSYVVRLSVGGSVVGRPLRVRTLDPPPGAELFRLATMSDLHIGRNRFGLRGTMSEAKAKLASQFDPDPFPIRCAREGVAEAIQWGADGIVFKGDMVDFSSVESWDAAASVIGPAAVGVPARYLPGNHEANVWTQVDAFTEAAHHNIDLIRVPTAWDVPGARLIILNTLRPLRHGGSVASQIAGVCDLLADARRQGLPAIVLMHHQLTRGPAPHHPPPGVPRDESRQFVRAMEAAGPPALVTSGHTHRQTRYRIGAVSFSEVGSPRDFPGVWGGYRIYEGGITQVVHRVEADHAVAWTDHSKWAVFGAWGVWSEGSLPTRCFAIRFDTANTQKRSG